MSACDFAGKILVCVVVMMPQMPKAAAMTADSSRTATRDVMSPNKMGPTAPNKYPKDCDIPDRRAVSTAVAAFF